MSANILEKLKIKPVPKKIEQFEIKVANPKKIENVTIKTKIIDKTKDKLINREEFIKKLNTVVSKKNIPNDEPIISEPPKKKAKKISKKLKLVEEITDSTTKTTTPDPKPRKTKQPSFSIIADDIDIQQIIGDTKVIERLPKKEKKILLRANAYYMNNRESFINFINALYKPFKEEFDKASKTLSCDRPKDAQFQLLTHQKIVRDYLNLYSPYRGLLLYHGLGTGKTCSSIAIAEGLKTDKQIIVMTPASLRVNYLQELKSCGDPLYKTNQYWDFIPIDKNSDKKLIDTIASVLSISTEYIKKHGGAWLVNVKKKSNFNELTAEQKKSLDLQINEMITHKYRFISYNGIRKSHVKDLTQNYTTNLFDNKVVIIDEAHNFVSRIVNKLRFPESPSMRLYEYLLSAQNCRIIFLSGTPIINYPNEIGIMFNMLRGYIKTWSIPLNIKTSKKINKNEMISIFKNLEIIDYLDYKPASKILTVTRNPFGFINVNKDGIYKGVSNFKIGQKGQIDDDTFIKLITSILKANEIDVISSSIKVENYKALPDTLDEFKNFFISPTNNNLTNENLFKRRIIGLSSHFRSATEKLMPTYNKDVDFKVLKIPMSDFQFGIYEQARQEERKLEKQNKKKARSDVYKETVSTYRIFSRAFCNFVFPPENPRPMPSNDKNINTTIDENIDEDILDAVPISEKIQNTDGLYGADDVDILEAAEKNNQDDSYPKRIKDALNFLQTNQDNFLSKSGLETYSPKFLNMLENIQDPDHRGLHLIYSQFRTLEGIGILKLILQANGFVEFKIKKNNTGSWQLNLKETGKPTFALYTGTEEDEEKEIIRNIYNGDWEKVPSSLVSEISPISTNNLYGEIIKVLMITSSGAEGISLKNTRYVHITEPYWHPVRTEQVIGRARRICSHQDLPEALRTVQVFLYLMTFTQSQLEGEASVQLKQIDGSKFDDKIPVSSDEALYEISTIKEKINKELLTAITESSMDCSLYNKPGSKDAIKCFSFGKTNPLSFSYKPSISNEESDNINEINKEKIKWKAEEIKIPINGVKVKFALNKATMEVYDYDSVEQSKQFGTDPVLVGRLVDKGDGKMKFVQV